jgi:hypothetical protein
MSFFTDAKPDIVDPATFDPARDMVFDRISTNAIQSSSLTYRRINIGRRTRSGTSELLIMTPRVFSYGVRVRTYETGDANGYQMGMCLYSRDGVKPEEIQFVEMFDRIVEQSMWTNPVWYLP